MQLNRGQFVCLVDELLGDAAPRARPHNQPWRLSPPEEFKLTLFLELVTGEHYSAGLLTAGVRTIDDCYDVYCTKRGHLPAPNGRADLVAILLDEASGCGR